MDQQAFTAATMVCCHRATAVIVLKPVIMAIGLFGTLRGVRDSRITGGFETLFVVNPQTDPR